MRMRLNRAIFYVLSGITNALLIQSERIKNQISTIPFSCIIFMKIRKLTQLNEYTLARNEVSLANSLMQPFPLNMYLTIKQTHQAMKNLSLTLFILANSAFGFGQNLIDNWKFQEDNMELKCTDWFNACGNELSMDCDTITHCGAQIYMDSPSLIPEDLWCLKLYGGFPQPGYAETYITGQSGTKVYELKYWMRSDPTGGIMPSFGHASIGFGAQSQFVASKSLEAATFTWMQYSFTDTLSLEPSDTLTVRLSSEMCDLCTSSVNFDFIELTVLDTVTSVKNIDPEEVKTYPNPATESISFDLANQFSGECLLAIYDITGKSIFRSVRFRERVTVDTQDFASGLYIYTIQSIADNLQIGNGKFAINN